jgi:hypothetical protein
LHYNCANNQKIDQEEYMSTPVYRLFFFRPGAKALELSQEEREAFITRLDAPGERLGVKLLLSADMLWSNERFEYFGLEQFPSQAAVLEYTQCLRELGWYDHIIAESYLGIPMDGTANMLTPPEPPAPGTTPIYRAYLARLTAYGHSLSPEKLEEVGGRSIEESRKHGGILLAAAYTRWNNEEWETFGIERYPDMEAVVRYSQYLSTTNWYKVWEARSFLGVANGGVLV